MSAIVATQLVKHFSPEIKAVDGIELDIPEGQIFGFLGQNGSGKTTTVRMLTTLLKPTSGSARVAGIDVFADPAAVRKKIGVALQEVGLDDLQTGRELLSLQARLFGVSSAETKKRIADLLDVVSMSDSADRAIKGYSGGMRRRLDLACALSAPPNVSLPWMCLRSLYAPWSTPIRRPTDPTSRASGSGTMASSWCSGGNGRRCVQPVTSFQAKYRDWASPQQFGLGVPPSDVTSAEYQA